jgi:LysR family hydrogen peroxide-inducible transcriptional activator
MPLITAKLPRLELYLIEEQTHVLMGRLLRGEIDVAILSPLGNEKELICHDLYDEAFLLAVPQMHPWAAFQSIQQASLCDQALLLLEDGHCMRDQALAVCQLSNASEIKNFRASSLETLRYMVASGRGVTLFPQLAIRQYDNIVYIPFAEPRPRRKISMLWRTTSAKHDLLQKMAEMLQTYCATKFS